MTNGMSPRIRHIVSSLAAVATTALLLSSVVSSFDPRLLTGPEASGSASPVIAAAHRPVLVRMV
jgi:hypothetical protein